MTPQGCDQKNPDHVKLYRPNDLISSAINCKGERGKDEPFGEF